MERLTDKTSVEFNPECSKVNPLTTNGKCPYYDKLAEFEDFMESLGCEELEQLEHLIGYPRFVDGYYKQEKEINRIEFITYKESFNEVFDKNKKLKQENQALKTKWQKLKELIKKDIKHNEKEFNESYIFAFEHYNTAENWVLDRMQELEKE